jgi:hypothetical protein
MAKKNIRDNSSLSPEELLEKAEEKLRGDGVLVEQTEDALREKVADTFEYYAEVDYLWVVEDGTAFLPQNLAFAHNYARNINQKIYKILR